MRYICGIFLIVVFFLSGPGCKRAQEAPVPKTEEKIVEKIEEQPSRKYVNRMKVDSEEATLKLVVGSENVHSIDLENKIPIRGVQFVLKGVTITDVRNTARTEGYLASFNKESGAVMLVETTGGKIEPGTGPIAEIECDKNGSPELLEIKIAK